MDEPVPEFADLGEYLAWFGAGDPDAAAARLQAVGERLADIDARRVGHDVLTVDGTTYSVSTVDLVIPNPGGRFETKVFRTDGASGQGSYTRRYVSREDAAAGHEEATLALRAGLLSEEDNLSWADALARVLRGA